MKAVIVHGWGGYAGEAWQSWLKNELEKKGWEVKSPKMPDTENPKINAWVGKLKEVVGTVDENVFLIGHSIGCQTIMRYLSGIDDKIGGCVLVAPFFNLLETSYEEEGEKEIAKPWLTEKMDFEKIKRNTGKIVCVFSDNDDCVPLTDSELFKKRLGAEIIIENKKGHFASGDEINKLPVVLEKLEEILIR